MMRTTDHPIENESRISKKKVCFLPLRVPLPKHNII